MYVDKCQFTGISTQVVIRFLSPRHYSKITGIIRGITNRNVS